MTSDEAFTWLFLITITLGLIAWRLQSVHFHLAMIHSLLAEQHIRATSPDPVARPSSHERLSSEKPA